MSNKSNNKEEKLTLAVKRPDIDLGKLYISTYDAAFGDEDVNPPSSHEALAAYFIGITAGAFASTDLAPRLAAGAVKEALFKRRDDLKVPADDLEALTRGLISDVTENVVTGMVREATQLAACALKEIKEEAKAEAAKKSTR